MHGFLIRAIAVTLVAAGAAQAGVFTNGETVCFLGDSITHGGRYHAYIYDYYLTRFPDCTIRFVNAGISGDSAGGAMGRLAEDVIGKKPTSVAVMLGMNDVGRGNYVAEPDEQKKAAQQGALERYRQNMDKLVGRIRGEAHPRLLLITPSPFDQTAALVRENQPGCNDGLDRCAAAVRELAAKHGGEVVDFNGPMTAFNAEQQKGHPSFTIVGADRVHPGPEGHLMMAWLFLKAQGAPSMVSEVAIDGASGRVTKAANAEVTGVERKDGTLRFTVMEKALPFPVAPAAKPLLGLLPVESDLNREMLSVTGLADGEYELRIDGASVGRHAAAALAAGVNLAGNEATPQARQAQEVSAMNENRRTAEVALRDLAAVRWFLRNRQVNPDDLAAVRTFAETKMAKTGYFEGKVAGYLEKWEKRAEAVGRVQAIERDLLALRRPAAHAYELRPVR